MIKWICFELVLKFKTKFYVGNAVRLRKREAFFCLYVGGYLFWVGRRKSLPEISFSSFCHVANALVWYAKLLLMRMFCSIPLLPLLAAFSQVFSEGEESSDVQSASHFFFYPLCQTAVSVWRFWQFPVNKTQVQLINKLCWFPVTLQHQLIIDKDSFFI